MKRPGRGGRARAFQDAQPGDVDGSLRHEAESAQAAFRQAFYTMRETLPQHASLDAKKLDKRIESKWGNVKKLFEWRVQKPHGTVDEALAHVESARRDLDEALFTLQREYQTASQLQDVDKRKKNAVLESIRHAQAQASTTRERLLRKEASLRTVKEQTDARLMDFSALNIAKSQGGRGADVRNTLYEMEAVERARLLRFLAGQEEVIAAAPAKDRERLRNAALDAVRQATDASDRARVDFDRLGSRVPPRFSGVDPDAVRDPGHARELVRDIRTFKDSNAALKLSETPEGRKQLVELQKLEQSIESRVGDLEHEVLAQRKAAPTMAKLRQEYATLGKQLDDAEVRGHDARARRLKQERARVEARLTRLQQREKTQSMRYDEDGKRVAPHAWDRTKAFFQDTAGGFAKKAEGKKDAFESHPITEEVGAWRRSLVNGAVVKWKARRLEKQERNYRLAQKYANASGFMRAFYFVRRVLTPAVVASIILGIFFIPWGIAQFFGWTGFVVIATGVNAGYNVLVELFNLVSSAIILGFSFLGNVGGALVNRAGQFIVYDLLKQPFSPYYFSLAGVRLQPAPLIDPLWFFPERFKINSWFAVVMDAVGLSSVGDLFRTGHERVLENFEPIRDVIHRRLQGSLEA